MLGGNLFRHRKNASIPRDGLLKYNYAEEGRFTAAFSHALRMRESRNLLSYQKLIDA